jgi:hypothetical protein
MYNTTTKLVPTPRLGLRRTAENPTRIIPCLKRQNATLREGALVRKQRPELEREVPLKQDHGGTSDGGRTGVIE